MNVTLSLNAEVERGLTLRALERGVTLDAYLQEIVAREAGAHIGEIIRERMKKVPPEIVASLPKDGEGLAPGPREHLKTVLKRWSDPNGDGNTANDRAPGTIRNQFSTPATYQLDMRLGFPTAWFQCAVFAWRNR